MTVLAITDIPRMTDLFERLARDRDDLVAVSDIHRGVEELERLKPGVVIIQNHLSGLSADILLKHLKSRIGRRRCRFILISPSETLEVETSGRFEGIMDPAQSDDELCSILDAFTHAADQRSGEITELPEAQADVPPRPDRLFQEFPPESGSDAASSPAGEPEPATGENLPEPLTYERPRRGARSVMSAFSQHLDNSSEELPTPDTTAAPSLSGYQREPFHLRDDLVITDIEETLPWYRRSWVAILALTVIMALVVTVYQLRHSPGTATSVPPAESAKPAKPAPPTPDAAQPAAKSQAAHSSTPQTDKPFAAHGTGRPRELPSFVPRDGHDKGYAKEHPGWERYLGQAHEYRVFREKDGAIRSIQVLDRSGAGIQESFYVTMLKGVAGTAAMRPVSSEIKEGYEIRRGDAGGLQVVQYRDAQGGRLRGIVVIWP